MHHAPMMNSALGLRHFNRFNDGDLIEMIGFVASTISTKSSLSAPSAYHRGGIGFGVLGGAGTGATHTDPTTPATDTGMVTMAMVTGRPAMITDMAIRLGVTTAAITAARTTEMTMKVLCAMFSPNTQFLGTAMTWPPSVVSSLKTVTT